MVSNRRECTFRSAVAGVDIFVERVFSGNGIGETVLILHGLGDHFGRHEWAVRLFTGLGYDVIGLDWPGNGRSGGKQGDLPSTESVGPLLEEVLGKEGIEPAGIFAHSTGGFFLIQTFGRNLRAFRNVKWVWLSSPLLHPEEGQARVKIVVAKRLARWFPKLTMSTGVRPSDCYHVEAGEDPEHSRDGNHNRITLRAGVDLILAGLNMKGSKIADVLKLPVLVTEGSEDEVCPPHLAEEFFEKLPEGEKTMIFLNGARHEPFREANRMPMLNSVRAWLSLQKSRSN